MKILISTESKVWVRKKFDHKCWNLETLCCPVQSGSNSLLKLMGRMNTAEEWRDYMVKINTKFPHIRLGTQLMVGFPTETEEDFRATLKLLDYPLSRLYIRLQVF